MSLRLQGYVELPAHVKPGGFDHAAVHRATARVYVAHTVNDALDVIFFNAALRHLYVAVGDPGILQVFDTNAMRLVETVPTEPGAHTTAFDPDRNRIYAFLPETHRAAVFIDNG